MIATVKRPLAVVSNGKLLEVTDRPDGRRTYHWRMDVPHTTYLVSVAIGDFTKVTDTWRGIPVEYHVPPGTDEATTRRSFGDTPKILEFYSQATGRPYPYAKYAQSAVLDYMWGGMENISATTQTARTLHDARAEVDSPSEGLVAHETAHQWFGDLLTCEDWSNAWLNEGFADYFTALYVRSAHGEDEFAWEVDDLRRSYLGEAERDYRRPIVDRALRRPDRHVRPPLLQQGGAGAPHAPLPPRRGGVVEGDPRLRRALRRADGDHADLQDAMETATGVSLGPLFEQYVYGAGHPELKVKWDYQPDTRQVHLEIRQTQKLDGQTGLFSFPLEVALVGERETAVRRVPVAARDFQDLYIPSDERPRTVVLDPGRVDPQDGRFHQAGRRVDGPAHRLQAPRRPAGGDPRARRARRRRGRGGARPGPPRGALPRRPARKPRRRWARSGRTPPWRPSAAGWPTRTAACAPSVLEALGAFPDHRELIPILRRALETDDSYAARAAAAGALGEFKKRRDEAAPVLIAALSQESFREQVRGAAIKALAKVDPARAWDHAVRLAKYGAPIDSRSSALEALVTIQKEDSHRRDEVRKILEGYLDDPYYSLRENAYRRLGELGDPAAIPAIERRARLEVEGRQRRNAEKADREDPRQRSEGARGSGPPRPRRAARAGDGGAQGADPAGAGEGEEGRGQGVAAIWPQRRDAYAEPNGSVARWWNVRP